MKKVIGLIMAITILTGCGTNQVNGGNNTNTESNNSSVESNDSKKTSKSNKELVCKMEYEPDQDGDRTIIYKSSFTFDKDGKKLEALVEDGTQKFKESRLSKYNIEQNKYDCKTVDSTEGLSCEYNVQDDGKVSQFIIKVDYANLDSEAREIAKVEGYLDVEDYNLEEAKEYMENDEYECEVK